jgi:outer membrane protein OmpA-like peptidoglycan-associated protein
MDTSSNGNFLNAFEYKAGIYILSMLIFIFPKFLLSQEADLTKSSTPETKAAFEQFINKNAPSEEAFIAVERIAEPFIKLKDWDKAIEVYKNYKNLFKSISARFDTIISILSEKIENLSVKVLNRAINTAGDEYSPVPSADEKSFYFTGRNRPDCIGGEDIFFSEIYDGSWQKAVNLGEQINTTSQEYITGISADGNRITFMANYQSSFGSGDLYYADKTKTGWNIQHFPEPINSQFFDCDGFITADGKAMLFTSDRPNGIGEFHEKKEPYHGDWLGNTDIYVVLWTENGWGKPINLGKKINTPFSERTPFLHPDGRTLYFSSDGHPGLGRLDVFRSFRLDDTWTNWTEPENLGKEINTAGEDYSIKITTSGTSAYFASSERTDGYGGSDIYLTTPLPRKFVPSPVATINGKVTDTKGNPLDADIKWEDLSSGKNMGQLKSDPLNGSFFITLPLGKNYGYYAEKEGYYPVTKNIDLEGKNEAIRMTENIVLISLDSIIPINNLFFESGKSKLKKESFPELKRVAKLFKSFGNKKVEICGHTDNQGSLSANMKLAKDRAQAVVDFLINEEGCDKDNLIAISYGPTRPVDTNATAEGRKRNRRVEFRIIK